MTVRCCTQQTAGEVCSVPLLPCRSHPARPVLHQRSHPWKSPLTWIQGRWLRLYLCFMWAASSESTEAASTSSTAAWGWGTSMQGGRLGRWDRVPAWSSLSEVLDTVLAALADRFSCLAFLALRACGGKGRAVREVLWVG